MSLKTTYRIFLIVGLLLFAGLNALAQEKYVVLKSKHQYSVPTILDGHKYYWRVFDESDNPLKFKLVDGDYVVVADGDLDYAEGAPVDIKWEGVESGKKYVLVLTEENATTKCSVDSEVDINIVETPLSIGFGKESEYRCADEANDGFIIPLLVKSSNTEIAVSYPITIEFKMKYRDGEWEPKTMKLESGSDLSFDYSVDRPDFIEDQSQDHYFTFRFKSVKDKHGAEVTFDENAEYIFGAYIKPPITKINNK